MRKYIVEYEIAKNSKEQLYCVATDIRACLDYAIDQYPCYPCYTIVRIDDVTDDIQISRTELIVALRNSGLPDEKCQIITAAVAQLALFTQEEF